MKKLGFESFVTIPDSKPLKVPTRVWYGQSDYLVVPVDSERLIRQLGLSSNATKVDYNHADFIWARDTYQIIYHTIFE